MAQALNVNISEVSLVVQGRAFLTPDKFEQACEWLGCRKTDVYSADVLDFIYGSGEAKPAVTTVKKDMRVRLEPDTMELVEFVADDEHLTKAQAANAIIRRAFETRRVEA
jgi:hypothetical protein